MKIYLAQINTAPYCLESNVEKILHHIRLAKKNKSELVVFPELALTGYACMDLFLNDEYILESHDLLASKILPEVNEDMTVILGFVDLDNNRERPDGLLCRYNSAAFIRNKKIVHVTDKTLLPDYDIFFEKRYFEQGRVPCNGIYSPAKGSRVGLLICEDMWNDGYLVNPIRRLYKDVDILIDISASPFYTGKIIEREKRIKRIVKDTNLPFIYVNCVGTYDGYDGEVVFEGRSLAYDKKANLLISLEAFKEDSCSFQSDILSANTAILNKEFSLLSSIEDDFDENALILDMKNAIVSGIRDYCSRTGFEQVVLGLSGGIDSAVVACLAVEALGKDNVNFITMPSDYTSNWSYRAALDLAENLKAGINSISIKPHLDSFKRNEEFKDVLGDITKTLTEENLQARIRGQILMAYSNKCGSLLLTTGNKTELALGYSTLYGDMNGGLNPLGDVDKLMVYKIASLYQEIPKDTLEKPPSAELAPGQEDEKGLGAGYDILSPLTNELVDGNFNKNDLYSRYGQDIVDKTIHRFKTQEFKRRQAPPAIKLVKRSFGIGRRVPM